MNLTTLNCATFSDLKCDILAVEGVDRTAVLDTEVCIIPHYQLCQNENGFLAALVEPLSYFLKGSCGVGRQARYDFCQGGRCPFCKVIF